MSKPKSTRVLPPIRVWQEPPTLEEAIVAAQAFTPDLEQQVEIAAGLMGLSAEAIRPSVLKAPPPMSGHSIEPQRGHTRAGTRSRAVGSVVVERRSRLPINSTGSLHLSGRSFQRG